MGKKLGGTAIVPENDTEKAERWGKKIEKMDFCA